MKAQKTTTTTATESEQTKWSYDDYGSIRNLLAVAGPLKDAADYNKIAPDVTATTAGLPDLAEPGETIRGKTVFGLTGDWDPGRPGNNNVRSQLDTGTSITPHKGVITFAFLDSAHATGIYNNPHQGFTEQYGYSPFNAAQRVAGRQAIQNWDDLVAVTFKEVNGPGGADIVMANTTTGPAQAWAYYPYDYGYAQLKHLQSDAWIATPGINPSNGQLDPGFYGLQTLNHELGHTLGLSHPGDYNFGDDQDGDGQPDPITYEGDAFYYQDNHQYTIMSYFDSFEAGNNQIDWNLMRFVYPSTPMVDDVWVIQQKYGADYTTRAGNTTYGFNATADVTNEAMRFDNGEMHAIFTIWDGGGNDTLDLSGFYTPSIIDLREGAYSSAGGLGAYDPDWVGVDPSSTPKADYLAFVNANNAAEGLGSRTAAYDLYFGGREGVNENIPWSDIVGKDWLMENNIGIARGAIIENAIGGHGDDRINGNQANNQLTGGDGADTFVFANDGSVDTIMDFQSGQDRIDLSELGITQDNVTINGKDIFANVGGSTLHIIALGDQVQMSDIFFG